MKNSHKQLPKKKKSGTEGIKQVFKLVIAKEDLSSLTVSPEDFEAFRASHPHIADLLLNPEKLNDNKEALEELQKDQWQTVALKIVATVKKSKNANVFHHAVDHVKLNIPDYPTIVKKPMDLGTVKKKLDLNIYSSAKEFQADMELIFSNCRLYNGVDSYVGRIGVDVNRVYDNVIQAYTFKERFENDEGLKNFAKRFSKVEISNPKEEVSKKEDSIDEQIQKYEQLQLVSL